MTERSAPGHLGDEVGAMELGLMAHTSETERSINARSGPAVSPTGTTDLPTNARTTVMQLDRPGNSAVFDQHTWDEARELTSRYPAGRERSALLPMLHLVQSVQSCITPDGIAFCSEVLGLTKAQVAAVATFYTMYKRKPVGEYLVSICTNTLCGLLGGDEIYEAVSGALDVGMNETTEDMKITLEHAECLAACDYAPVVTVNYEFFDNQTVASTQDIVARLRAGERPRPTRGAPLCSFREIERQIAGLGDPRPEVVDSTATGAPTEVGVRLALERRESAPGYTEREQVLAARTEHEQARAHAPRRSGFSAPKTDALYADGTDDGTDRGKAGGGVDAEQVAAQSPALGGAAGPRRETSANDAGVPTFESDPNAGHNAEVPGAPGGGDTTGEN